MANQDTNQHAGQHADQHADQSAPPFFVGYLPMPAALKRFYWPLAVLLIAACGVAGYWIAAQQQTSGAASWANATAITMQGVVTLAPYPVLHRQQHGAVESVLLVAQGKHSAHQLAAAFDGQAVAIAGYQIRRGGWTMLEIDGTQAIQKTSDVSVDELAPWLNIKSLGDLSLSGEIADSKCFLGVMRPGSGTIHKACAAVCLLGGIPPMLVAKDAQQQKYGYLLADADGNSAATLLAEYVAEPVQISGQLQQQGDLLFITIDHDGIQRR